MRMSPLSKVQGKSISRTNSSPVNFESSIDRPMRLAEIYVAAEHSLQNTISDSNLWKELSSVMEFEVSLSGSLSLNVCFFFCFHTQTHP